MRREMPWTPECYRESSTNVASIQITIWRARTPQRGAIETANEDRRYTKCLVQDIVQIVNDSSLMHLFVNFAPTLHYVVCVSVCVCLWVSVSVCVSVCDIEWCNREGREANYTTTVTIMGSLLVTYKHDIFIYVLKHIYLFTYMH